MTNTQLAVLVGGGLLGLVYLKRSAGQAVDAVGQAINPVNHGNIFNRGVNALVQSLTGEKDATLGTKIYDWMHG